MTATNKATLVAAGKRLELAAAATRDMLRTYRDASTRYGTAEEWRLSQKLLTDLQAARTVYGQRAGVTLPIPTAKQRSTARELFEASLAVVASEQIVRWTGDEGLATALTAGSLKTVKARLGQELTTRVRRQAEKAINDATGLSLVLNVPLKQQVRFQLERLASNWLARAVLHVSPQGLLIQLAGAPIVNWIGANLQAALRNSGNTVGRAESTMAQFAAWRSQMALLAPTSSLGNARALAAKVERELNRTGFLELDLRRAGKTAVLAQLEQAEVADPHLDRGVPIPLPARLGDGESRPGSDGRPGQASPQGDRGDHQEARYNERRRQQAHRRRRLGVVRDAGLGGSASDPDHEHRPDDVRRRPDRTVDVRQPQLCRAGRAGGVENDVRPDLRCRPQPSRVQRVPLAATT